MAIYLMETEQVAKLIFEIQTALKNLEAQDSSARQRLGELPAFWQSIAGDEYTRQMGGDLLKRFASLREQGVALQNRLINEKTKWEEVTKSLYGTEGAAHPSNGYSSLDEKQVLDDSKNWSSNDAGLEWVILNGDAYKNLKDIQISDINQGDLLGDCYLLAALGSIANKDPSQIKNLLQRNDDGTYTVRFFDVSDPNNPKPVFITVDGTHFPKNSNRVTSADGNLWAAIVEKAYAKWKGGYSVIGKGGFPDIALHEMTGHPPDVYGINTESISQYYLDKPSLDTFSQVLVSNSNQPMTVTFRVDVLNGLTGYNNFAAGLFTNLAGEGDRFHALSVKSIDVASQMVTIYNPWGSKDEFTLSFEDLYNQIGKLSVAPQIPVFADPIDPSKIAPHVA